jgi:hypothetical protein
MHACYFCVSVVLWLQAGQERLYNALKVQLQGMVEELIEQTRRWAAACYV